MSNRRLGRIEIKGEYIREFLESGSHYLFWKTLSRDMIILRSEDNFASDSSTVFVWSESLPPIKKECLIPLYDLIVHEIRNDDGDVVDYRFEFLDTKYGTISFREEINGTGKQV